MTTRTTRIALSALGLAVAGATAFGSVSIADAATPSASASPHAATATATTGVPFRAVSAHAIRAQFGAVPSALRTDLHALTGKKGQDRVAAVEAIERKALAGSYGAEVKGAASAAATAWKDAPASLKQDLATARHAEGAERTKALGSVRTKALAGDYGSAVQTWAKTVEANVRKQQAERLSADVGAIV